MLEALTFFDRKIDPPALLTDDGKVLLNAVHTGCLADTVLGIFPSLIGKPLTVSSPAAGFQALKSPFDLRLYRPRRAALSGAWKPPPVEQVRTQR